MYVQYVFTLYIYDIYIDAQWLLDESFIHFFVISGTMYHFVLQGIYSMIDHGIRSSVIHA